MRVLITGASGKVAQRIVPLLAVKFDLKFTDLKHRTGAPEPLQTADLTKLEQALEVVRDVDAVVHMAIASTRDVAGKDVGLSQLSPEQREQYHQAMFDVNVHGTRNVFEGARRNGIKRIVYCSSILAALGWPRLPSIDATTRPRPANLYACTKLFGENLGEVYSRRGGMTVICLRLAQPYPGIYPWEAGMVKKPEGRAMLVAVEDVAQAVQCALLNQTVSFGAYYVVSQCSTPSIDVSASAEIGYKPRVRFTDDERMVSIEDALT